MGELGMHSGNVKLPQYVTLADASGLPNERVLSLGNGLQGSDRGAGQRYVLAVTNGIYLAGARPRQSLAASSIFLSQNYA